MSIQTQRVETIARQVRRLRQAELTAKNRFQRTFYWICRWLAMLSHEFVRDDVKIRAESLAFLMVFSLLPLIAGLFFIFNIFTQFGMVQDALQEVVNQFLYQIPEAHRDFVSQYVIRFKDAYLHSISHRSGTVGIFALFILIWVGLSTFDNLDRTLNHIWSSDKERPFFEKLRNFLFVSVAAPLILTSALSVPLILRRIPATQYVLERLPVLSVLLNAILVPSIVIGTFAVVYRYVPVRKVRWRSAFGGAFFAAILLVGGHWLMQLYFRFGTHTAYGKAAIAPLMLFWIYIVWIVVILGAELSFLMQNEREVLAEKLPEPTFREGEGLIIALLELMCVHRDGKKPLDFEKLRQATGLPTAKLQYVLEYLCRQGFTLRCQSNEDLNATYVLAKDPSLTPLSELLRDFFRSAWHERQTKVEERWQQSLEHWLGYFQEQTLGDWLKRTKR